MVKARKLPSGNWRALAYSGIVNGKRSYKSFTAPTRKEAEFLAAEYALKKGKLYITILLSAKPTQNTLKANRTFSRPTQWRSIRERQNGIYKI